MTDLRGRPPLVPVALAVAMLAVVLAAALGPATGTVAAAASCQYGTCPSSGPSALTWGIGALLAAVILIVALAVILQRRRGGPPSSGGSVTPWSGTAAESPAPAEAPPYMETPDDVGVAAAGAGAAAGAAAGSEPGDIDSLMGELDRISGEILKRGPGKKGPPTGDSEPESSSDN